MPERDPRRLSQWVENAQQKVVPFAHAGAGISVEAAAALHARQPCASDRPAQKAIRAMGAPWQSVRQEGGKEERTPFRTDLDPAAVRERHPKMGGAHERCVTVRK